jgi:hypothetical protein
MPVKKEPEPTPFDESPIVRTVMLSDTITVSLLQNRCLIIISTGPIGPITIRLAPRDVSVLTALLLTRD